MILSQPTLSPSTKLPSSSFTLNTLVHSRTLHLKPINRKSLRVSASSSSSRALQALIFDCDGVILESEHLHRQAYNDAFSHFNVRCDSSSPEPLNWSIEFYDELQNLIGGGKPKMRWSSPLRSSHLIFFSLVQISLFLNISFCTFCRYFKEHGWPSSTVFDSPPQTDDQRAELIDILQVL